MTSRDLVTPPTWWCLWQSLKCTNPFTYTVEMSDMRGKWVLATGANNGIGREAVLQMASWGANVILACREPPSTEVRPEAVLSECFARAEAAGHQSQFEWWQCDSTDLRSIKAVGTRWMALNRPLDILLNNAGITERSKLTRTVNGFEILHQVNFLAHTLLTMTVLPSLARSSQPRIICTTSCMQYFGDFDVSNMNSGMNSYSNNKLYFQTWLTEFQRRCSLKPDYDHLVIHGVHPGYVKTGIWNGDRSRSEMGWLQWSLNVLLHYIGIDSQQGSLTLLYAATAAQCSKGGKFYNRVWEEQPMPQTRQPIAMKAIWSAIDGELRQSGLGDLSLLD